jgi:stage III sporulation protein AE
MILLPIRLMRIAASCGILLIAFCALHTGTANAIGEWGSIVTGLPPPVIAAAAAPPVAGTGGDLAQGTVQPTQSSGTANAAIQPTLSPTQAAANEYQSMSQNAIEQAWSKMVNEYQGYVPDTAVGQYVPSFFSGGHFQFSQLGQGLLRFFIQAIIDNGKLLGAILILAVLTAVLETMQSAFESQLVGQVAFLVVHLVLIVLAVSSFRQATLFASGAIDTMTSVMFGSLPIVLALISTSGGLTSAATFHPLIVFSVNAMGFFVLHVVFPLIFFTAVLMIVSSITGRFKVTELAGFLRTVTMGALGVGMTIFLGIMSLQGSIASITDGVTLKSAKYLFNLTPVVGKALSDAADSIAGASLIVKNATGLASAVVLLIICAFPALKILAMSIVYSGAAAVLQPLGETPIIASLSVIGKSLALFFAALSAVGLMFFFSMVITLSATNLTAYVR